MSEKKDFRSCFGCTHKRALPDKHPCVRCHGASKWKKQTEKQWKRAKLAQEVLEKSLEKETKANYQKTNWDSATPQS